MKFLSGGERIRLKLAMLMFQDINLLILDEPTNHLDIESIETLEAALADFKGTIFFISHDRYFINKIGERVIAVENCGLKSYEGNYDDYKRERAAVEPMPILKEKAEKVQRLSSPDPGEKLLKKIESLEKEITELDLVMGIRKSYEELDQLFSRKQQLNNELELAMEMWLSAGE
ncbi:ATP-binding cassette domain-containing protein [Mesobacillus subterraneus]|uniref:ABC transporter C-terminal domain-containing protein n=1 Tax=Mesobacillus subterraneus TaxID=285983 RepID=UPI00273F7A35|nr:ATP-binding cassette domain-containing protein [Mesobacillus subterraneus]WLR54757.1 ATP-binding cassette domain-containing protein [Mesobacillus subterraneus]